MSAHTFFTEASWDDTWNGMFVWENDADEQTISDMIAVWTAQAFLADKDLDVNAVYRMDFDVTHPLNSHGKRVTCVVAKKSSKSTRR